MSNESVIDNLCNIISEVKDKVSESDCKICDDIIYDIKVIFNFMQYLRKTVDEIRSDALNSSNEEYSFMVDNVMKALSDSNNDNANTVHEILRNTASVFYNNLWGEYAINKILTSNVNDEVEPYHLGVVFINAVCNALSYIFDSPQVVFPVMRLAIVESIKGRENTSNSVCILLNCIINDSLKARLGEVKKIKDGVKYAQRKNMSDISSKRKSKQYEKVMSILSKTVSKHKNASVNSLIDKLVFYFETNRSKEGGNIPSRNSIRSWIKDDLEYTPEVPTVNTYDLVIE